MVLLRTLSKSKWLRDKNHAYNKPIVKKRCAGIFIKICVLLSLWLIYDDEWLPIKEYTRSKLEVNTHKVVSTMASTGLSESSQGNLFVTAKVREYNGPTYYIDSSKSSRLRTDLYPRMGRSCKNWVVITTIFPPTLLIRQLASLQDWCTVIVGDKKSPKDYRIYANEEGASELAERAEEDGRLVYLTAEKQSSLPYKIIPLLKWNHFGRKNIGFLYAMHHGAEFIYDTDDDNILQTADIPLEQLRRGMTTENGISKEEWPRVQVEKEVYTYNPYYKSYVSVHQEEHVFTWPRGMPLDLIRNPKTYTNTNLKGEFRDEHQVTILQSLADHDPDVDAIYRLTAPLPLEFAAKGTPENLLGKVEVLAKGVFTPFNAQAVLFSKPSFWGMFMPVTVHGRVTDIWRSYFTQRLMWDLDQSVAFSSPFVTQCRNPHFYLADFDGEEHLYSRSGALLRMLKGWNPKSDSLPGRIEELAVLLYETSIIEERDVKLYSSWVKDLYSIGYKFPELESALYSN